MTIRLNPRGYKPSKKEQIEHNIDNFDQRIEKALDYLSAGFMNQRQFISEINVAHGNYKRNQRRIYNLEG